MNTMKSLFVFLTLLLQHVSAASAIRGVRSSSMTTGAGQRRLDKKPEKRECDFSIDRTKLEEEVEFKCKSKVESELEEIKDKIKFKIKSDERGLVVKVEYEQEIENEETDVEVETETKYEIVFARMVEYQKSANANARGDGAYDWENDVVVSEMPMLQWNPMSEVVDDGVRLRFSMSTPDDVATFTFTISRATVGEAVTANKMKIDFELKNYQWTQDNTNVALICNVETERKIDVDYNDKEAERNSEPSDLRISFQDVLETTGMMPFGEYTWATKAFVLAVNETEIETIQARQAADGSNLTMTDFESAETIAVIATSPEVALREGETTLAFSFVGDSAKSAADIFWDPEAGIGYSASAGVSLTMFSSLTVTLAVCFALVV